MPKPFGRSPIKVSDPDGKITLLEVVHGYQANPRLVAEKNWQKDDSLFIHSAALWRKAIGSAVGAGEALVKKPWGAHWPLAFRSFF
jgi:hypothetical protein